MLDPRKAVARTIETLDGVVGRVASVSGPPLSAAVAWGAAPRDSFGPLNPRATS